jgi:hypothetical protein
MYYSKFFSATLVRIVIERLYAWCSYIYLATQAHLSSPEGSAEECCDVVPSERAAFHCLAIIRYSIYRNLYSRGRTPTRRPLFRPLFAAAPALTKFSTRRGWTGWRTTTRFLAPCASKLSNVVLRGSGLRVTLNWRVATPAPACKLPQVPSKRQRRK